MLRREYGILTPSPLAAPIHIHAEDAQPNEAIDRKRGRNLPPPVRPKAPPLIQAGGGNGYTSTSMRGGIRGRGSWAHTSQRGGYQGKQLQNAVYATQNHTWRGRGFTGHAIDQPDPPGRAVVKDTFAPPLGPRASGWSKQLSSNASAHRPAREPPQGPSATSNTPTGPRSMHMQAPIARNDPLQRSRSPLPSCTPTSPRFKRRKLAGPLVQRRDKSEEHDPLVPSPPPPTFPAAQPAHEAASASAPLSRSDKDPSPTLITSCVAVVVKNEEDPPIKLEHSSSSDVNPCPLPQIPGKPPKAEVTVKTEIKTEIKLEPIPPLIPPAPPTTSSPSAPIKLEHPSPSPSPPPQRRLITESCNFYPFPLHCHKSHPSFRENRRAFFLEKDRELGKLGLRKTKVFSRDDGLVIEWKSKIPVWSDTFRPDEPEHKSDLNSPEIIDLT